DRRQAKRHVPLSRVDRRWHTHRRRDRGRVAGLELRQVAPPQRKAATEDGSHRDTEGTEDLFQTTESAGAQRVNCIESREAEIPGSRCASVAPQASLCPRCVYGKRRKVL